MDSGQRLEEMSREDLIALVLWLEDELGRMSAEVQVLTDMYWSPAFQMHEV